MKIIQLHNSTPSQMMGFLLVTDGGKLIAVDGGTEGDAPSLNGLCANTEDILISGS